MLRKSVHLNTQVELKRVFAFKSKVEVERGFHSKVKLKYTSILLVEFKCEFIF